MFRFVIIGQSTDPDTAIEGISDIVPLENARTDGELFAAETRPMDGWRNSDTANMNQLQLDGKIGEWGKYTDLQRADIPIMRYGTRS